MHRIDGPGATGQSLFTEGNPATGTPATTVTADWLNAVQEELVELLAALGGSPDKQQNDQLATALLAALGELADASAPATQAEAEAGTETALRAWSPLRVAQAVAALTTGRILQIVQGSTSTPVAINTATWTDTGLTADITPIDPGSTVLVLVSQQAGGGDSSSPYTAGARVLRGSDVLLTSNAISYGSYANNAVVATAFLTAADQPGAGTHTYKTQVARTANSGGGGAQQGGGLSTIMLIEIGS